MLENAVIYYFTSSNYLQKILSIHKSRKKNLMTNYHIIMMKSVLAKFFGKLIESKLSTWIKSHQRKEKIQEKSKVIFALHTTLLAIFWKFSHNMCVLWKKSQVQWKSFILCLQWFSRFFLTLYFVSSYKKVYKPLNYHHISKQLWPYYIILFKQRSKVFKLKIY